MKGVLFILLAELSFVVSSVFAKYALADSEISGIQITFFRFLFGAIIAATLLKTTRSSFKPNNPKLVIMRAISNTVSAMLFFYALRYTTVTNANMLGMTYPLWVVLFAPLIIKEKFEWKNIIFLIIALLGVYLVINPNFSSFNIGDICAFFSGVLASIAVLALKQARKYDSTDLIIFYVMFIGFIINSIFLIPVWVNPNNIEWIFIIISALLGFSGQVFITKAYKYIEASKGSLISSSRILMAGALGVMLFSDKISIQLISGAILILAAQFGLIQSKISKKDVRV